MTAVKRPGKRSRTSWGYFTLCLRKYVDGNGRARRSEYWFFILYQLLILLVPLAIIVPLSLIGDRQAEIPAPIAFVVAILALVLVVIYLGLILPGITAMIRRFHDVGLTGWLILLGLIPYVGGVITFIITLLPSQAHANKHGPVPDTQAQSVSEIFS